MSAQTLDLLRQALLKPEACLGWSNPHWELLLQQARRANLLGRLAQSFRQAALLSAIPAGPRVHLEGIRHLTDSQLRSVRWELRHIDKALAGLDGPVVILKGAAYVLCKLPTAEGRLFSDIDILVPRRSLDAVELSLTAEGWQSSHHDAHDQRYYREWMHEIPPMQHLERETVIDVHHNILPLTSRIKLDAPRLFERIVPIEGWPGLYRLGNADLVLHSACHLFLDGEFDKGLRDLVDVDALLRHFSSTTPGFWHELTERAQALGLERVLFYALRYAQTVLGTPVPAEATQAVVAAAPARLMCVWMDAVFRRALQPDHPSCADRWSGLARSFLYLRAHWMRMPPHLLLPHLLIKAWKRRFGKDANQVAQAV